MTNQSSAQENPSPRVIKKYPNRRLYDTSSSSYITLESVKELVLREEHFQVIDSKTGADLTRAILIQIIGEQESQSGNPMFSNQLLMHIIRFYGDSMQGMMGEYLERSVNSFMEQQTVMRRQMQAMMENNPMTVLGQMTKQNMDIWEHFMRNAATPMSTRHEQNDTSEKPASSSPGSNKRDDASD